jgi:hypothetical protein
MNTRTHKIIGTTQDVTDCECCGRTDLKKTVIVAILDADGNTTGVAHYGTVCAAHATKRTAKQITNEANAADAAQRAAKERERAERSDREYRAYMAWLTNTTGIADQWAAQLSIGGPLAAHRLYAAHAAA